MLLLMSVGTHYPLKFWEGFLLVVTVRKRAVLLGVEDVSEVEEVHQLRLLLWWCCFGLAAAQICSRPFPTETQTTG